jgi:hypothetical protein
MNLRKPRPLTRDPASFRDDRLFIIACDDTYAPKQYFDFFRLPRVRVHVEPTIDGTSAARVLERLVSFAHEAEEDDELWLLLDTDHFTTGTHLPAFTSTLTKARQHGVNVALSKPCFELWLLLHHVPETALGGVKTAADVSTLLRQQLGEYNKKKLKSQHYPLSSVCEACLRAERLDGEVQGNDIPIANTTRVYRLWRAIVAKALPHQLPAELHPLLGRL